MPRICRRAAVLGLLATVTTAVTAWGGSTLADRRPVAALLRRLRVNNTPPLTAEAATNEPIPGGGDWRIDGVTTKSTSDRALHVAAYASATSVKLGGKIDFHVSLAKPGPYWVEIYRMGFYGGEGARRVAVSPRLAGVTQAAPKKASPLGAISCGWEPSWRLAVPAGWNSGYYLAVFTTETGFRCYTPIVVRDDARTADLCVVIPFTTYQAYNLWPKNGKLGKSLYYGYKKVIPAQGGQPSSPTLDYNVRAFEVSFDRPYANSGLPMNYDLDLAFIAWAEEAGYSMVFAASEDLHAGRINPRRYKGVVFSGHDEYWSRQMRDHAAAAVTAGTSLVFLSANNVYWHIRMPDTTDRRSGRLVTCYKGDVDTGAQPATRTARWREPEGSNEPEQSLLGVMFNGILEEPVPLVVREPGHWFWAGTGVSDGEQIPGIVGFEADGLDAAAPRFALGRQVLLSASPYVSTEDKAETQNTSVIEADNGAIVFAAASLTWPRALRPDGDPRIQRATANLLDRIVRRTPVAAGG